MRRTRGEETGQRQLDLPDQQQLAEQLGRLSKGSIGPELAAALRDLVTLTTVYLVVRWSTFRKREVRVLLFRYPDDHPLYAGLYHLPTMDLPGHSPRAVAVQELLRTYYPDVKAQVPEYEKHLLLPTPQGQEHAILCVMSMDSDDATYQGPGEWFLPDSLKVPSHTVEHHLRVLDCVGERLGYGT